MSTRQLDRAFNPKSLALVGASDRAGSAGQAVLDNLVSAGFAGVLHVVNPRHEEIAGRRCFKSLRDLPEPPDLAIVVAPSEKVEAIVQEAADLSIPAAIVMTDDLKPGADSLFERLRAIARRGSIRIFGPNCHGVIAPRVKLNASLLAQPVRVGDLAVISQSAAVMGAIVAWGHSRQVGFSGLAALGEMADVDIDDLLDFFALDPMTRAIMLYVERLEDAKGFMSAARAASRVKPVIVVRSGATRRRAAPAPTPAISPPPTMSTTPPSAAPGCCAFPPSTPCSTRRRRSGASSPSTAKGSRSSPMAAASAFSPSTNCSTSAASSPTSRPRPAMR